MLSLRTADGLSLDRVPEQPRRHIVNSLLPFARVREGGPLVEFSGETGSLLLDDATIVEDILRSGKNVRLTDPAGFLLSNDIISSVFAALAR